jgi:sterol desaturase/sphingolipid hydroxylase (fatty acid hydroxylase superfamily)
MYIQFTLVVPISLGLHPFTEWVWLLLAIQLSVDAHSGYDFCVLDKLPFLFFWGGNKHPSTLPVILAILNIYHIVPNV